MIVPYKFTYLVYSLVFAIPWLLFFLHRKDLRKQMIFSGLFLAVLSVLTAYLWWTVDWWKPETITGSIVGIEDFLLGFFSGGIGAVAYEELFKKVLYRSRVKRPKLTTELIVIIILLVLIILTWVFGFLSWVASSIAMGIGVIALFIVRKDLILNSLLSGIILATLSLIPYYITIIISPGWIERTWLFENLTGKLFTGIPIEDIVFWFLMGLLVGPFYEVWSGRKVRDRQ